MRFQQLAKLGNPTWLTKLQSSADRDTIYRWIHSKRHQVRLTTHRSKSFWEWKASKSPGGKRGAADEWHLILFWSSEIMGLGLDNLCCLWDLH
jgi:hypothetical protein